MTFEHRNSMLTSSLVLALLTQCLYVQVLVCTSAYMYKCLYVQVLVCTSACMYKCLYVQVLIMVSLWTVLYSRTNLLHPSYMLVTDGEVKHWWTWATLVTYKMANGCEVKLTYFNVYFQGCQSSLSYFYLLQNCISITSHILICCLIGVNRIVGTVWLTVKKTHYSLYVQVLCSPAVKTPVYVSS